MNWTLVRLDEVDATPWRNGGGVTRELLAWPGANDWRVRMSVAEVAQDGPFSRFDGVHRWFAVLAGAGVRLRLAGVTHALTGRSPPFALDGGTATDCALIDGATQDFNLMLRGSVGEMVRVQGVHAAGCSAGALVALYAGRSGAAVVCGNEELQIGPQTLAWRILGADQALRAESPDALWMEIKP
ncbi:MAG: HutD family protein [Ramlibacter sp.]|nr:HutD family protein [Ramlibacter sp.]